MKTQKTILVFTVFFVITLLSNSLFSKSKGIEQDANKFLAFAEVMPAPEGGIGAIIKTIKYPSTARKAGIGGKVYVLAHVNENGDAEEVKVVRGIGGGCDEAAVEAVKKAHFTPGQNKGKNVRVKLTMAITFKIR